MMLGKRPVVVSEQCTGCGVCVAICPPKAISIHNGKALISQQHCKACNKCVRFCKQEAIVLVSLNNL